MTSVSSIHEFSCYEPVQWNKKIREIVVIDQRRLADVLYKRVLEFIQPHPCSNEIKRFKKDRLRWVQKGTPRYDSMFIRHLYHTFDGGYCYHTYDDFLDDWLVHKNEDKQDNPQCRFCYSLELRLESLYITQEKPIDWIAILRYTPNMSLYRIHTSECKRFLVAKGLYHPEGYGYIRLMDEIRTNCLIRWRQEQIKKNGGRLGPHRFGKTI